VRLERAYESALRLYPADYRARFAGEMLTAFGQAVTDHHGTGIVALVRFAVAELTALVSGIAAEWLAKLTSDKAARGRCLPDCRMIRGWRHARRVGRGPRCRRQSSPRRQA
jgi:hypothetical protein